MSNPEIPNQETAPRLEALLNEYQDIGAITEILRDEGFSADKVKSALEGKGFVVEKTDLSGEVSLSISQVKDGKILFGFPKTVSW